MSYNVQKGNGVSQMADERRLMRHKMIVENRESVSLTGITDVISFDEDQVICDTDLGVLIIKGSGLHVSNLNVDSGELDIHGEITAITYEESVQRSSKSSFFGKIFK